MKQPVLSICIPTFNRAKFLQISLERLFSQLQDVDSETLEIFISDNCSTDLTGEVVQYFIDRGMPIAYSRNSENIGMDGNFLKCIRFAKGKYILLLGDDDAFVDGAIKYLIELLSNGNLGFLHISCTKSDSSVEYFHDADTLLKRVSYRLTFISSNIFRSDIVNYVIDPESYFYSYFLQLPFYIKSISSHKESIVVNRPLFQAGLDSRSNGGYNFYKVFVASLLDIMQKQVLCNLLSKNAFDYFKRDLYCDFLIKWNYRLLIKHRNVKNGNEELNGRGGFIIDGAWKTLYRYYGKHLYFYFSFLKFPIFVLKDLIGKFKK